MNLSILFVFICIIALIIYKRHLKSNSTTFAFAQKGGGGGRRGGKGGRGGGRGGPKGGSGGGNPNGPSGPSGPGGQGGPSGGGLPVTTMDQLDSIFNTIGFKFSGGGVLPKAMPSGLPPMPGSNNDNLDAILKQMMN